MRYRLETPAPGVTTDIGPVHFHLGVAEVDDSAPNVPQVLAYCRNNGYGVHELDAPAAAEVEVEVDDDDNDPATRPPANAKVEVWRAHVLALGATEDQVAGATKDQLKELADQLAKEGDQQ